MKYLTEIFLLKHKAENAVSATIKVSTNVQSAKLFIAQAIVTRSILWTAQRHFSKAVLMSISSQRRQAQRLSKRQMIYFKTSDRNQVKMCK